jgi:ABC-type lipoprotein release transport system permease subunit
MLPKVDSIRLKMGMQSYYLEVAVKDSWRARTTLLTTATVFAGICLLLLVLIGLKSGLIQRLYDDIMTSWSSTNGDWYATSSILSLDADGEAAVLAKLPHGSILMPEITKIVALSTATTEIENVTVQATVPGDPFLRFYNAEIANSQSPELVISPAIAKELGLTETSLPLTATIALTRGDGGQAVTATLRVIIRSIVGIGGSNAKAAYLSRYFMEQFEDFTQGEAVVEHGWPGLPVEDSIGYQGYLAFSKKPYSPDDINRLHIRGFKAKLISNESQFQDPVSGCRLYGLLKPHDLHVYFVTSETQDDRMEQYLNFDVNEVEAITTSDDVLLYWSEPITARIDNRDHLVVGVTGSLRWLRSYFRDVQTRFTEKGLSRVMLPLSDGKASVTLQLVDGQTLNLMCVPIPQSLRKIGASHLVQVIDRIAQHVQTAAGLDLPFVQDFVSDLDLSTAWANSVCRAKLVQLDQHLDSLRQPIAVVPANLLVAIHRHRQGSLSFDPMHQSFQRVSTPNRYFSGRFYARVLEDVPVIDEQLQQLGYSTVSSKLRVLEMQGYAGTLDLLVNILQVIAIALGVVTASVIFMELTRRRQTSIGIMRIMGMNSFGIFLFVFIRAILIAGLGWAMASFVALIIAQVMPILTHAECRLTMLDYTRVLAGSVLCSALGVSYHAYVATKLDPIEAINAGKVQ